MLVINNKSRALILNKNINYKIKRGLRIDFSFNNPLYNELLDIDKAYLVGDFIYIVGKLNKTYSNIFPQVGDLLEYSYTIGKVEEDIYE